MTRQLSKKVWDDRISKAIEGKYEFIRWDCDGFGCNFKVVCKCLCCDIEWSSKSVNIINGKGCPNCKKKSIGDRFRKPEMEYISLLPEEIKFISWIDGFKNQSSKAKFGCVSCSNEWITSIHSITVNHSGCPSCAKLNSGDWKRFPKERWENLTPSGIKFFNWVGKYTGCASKAKYGCMSCGGAWKATPNSIISKKSGCPYCAKSGYNKSKTGVLYALRSECGRYVKIGISNDPKRRHNELEKRTPFKFNIVEQISGDGAKIAELEKYFHSKYERAGFARFDGCTEWLICTPQLLEELRELEDVK